MARPATGPASAQTQEALAAFVQAVFYAAAEWQLYERLAEPQRAEAAVTSTLSTFLAALGANVSRKKVRRAAADLAATGTASIANVGAPTGNVLVLSLDSEPYIRLHEPQMKRAFTRKWLRAVKTYKDTMRGNQYPDPTMDDLDFPEYEYIRNPGY